MKKLLSILSIACFLALMAPSCSSDEDLNEISAGIQVDQTAPHTGNGSGTTPGGD